MVCVPHTRVASFAPPGAHQTLFLQKKIASPLYQTPSIMGAMGACGGIDRPSAHPLTKKMPHYLLGACKAAFSPLLQKQHHHHLFSPRLSSPEKMHARARTLAPFDSLVFGCELAPPLFFSVCTQLLRCSRVRGIALSWVVVFWRRYRGRALATAQR